jgi:hypothetical protein
LNRIEGRLIDDGRNFVFDNLRLRLAFAVALPGELIEVPNAGVGAPREYFVNSTRPEQ